MSYIRELGLELMTLTRQSRLRRPVLSLLVKTHNASYHLLSFFATTNGIHPKHKILNYHQFFIDHTLPADKILDVGCGYGEVAYDLAKHAAKVVGIDFSAKSITSAQKRYQRPNLTFVVGDATTEEFKDQFDVIILSNVLEHIEHRPEFLKKLAHVAPKILIRVPMITRDWLAVYKKEAGFEYRLDDTHFIEFDEKTFRTEVTQAGLVVEQLFTRFGELYAVCKRP